jgi:hypothetical protein
MKRDHDILKEKIGWIKNSYFSLFILGIACNQYEEGWHLDQEKFSAYVNRLYEGAFFTYKETGRFPYGACNFLYDPYLTPLICLDSLKRLSSPQYDPPADLLKILDDLKSLWKYWINCLPDKAYSINSLAGVSEEGLDLALVKLSYYVGIWKKAILSSGDRDIARTAQSTQKKREKAETLKNIVLAIYKHGQPIPPGTKLSEVCRIIIKQFEQSKGNKDAKWGEIRENTKTPTRDSIINYLTKKGILTNDFEHKGRYWFKKM